MPDDAEPAPVRGNLPAELNAFVGRDDELTGIEPLLRESRLVTVAGVAGVGKSRFVTRAAALMGNGTAMVSGWRSCRPSRTRSCSNTPWSTPWASPTTRAGRRAPSWSSTARGAGSCS